MKGVVRSERETRMEVRVPGGLGMRFLKMAWGRGQEQENLFGDSPSKAEDGEGTSLKGEAPGHSSLLLVRSCLRTHQNSLRGLLKLKRSLCWVAKKKNSYYKPSLFLHSKNPTVSV